MRIKLKFAGLFGLAAVAALLAMAVGPSAAGASAFKTSGSFPVSFSGEGLGLSRFLGSKLNLVLCHMSRSTGAVTSSTLAKVTITYLTGCEVKGTINEACPTITTKELLIEPLSKLNGTTKLGLLIQPKSGATIAEFTCSGGNKVKVTVTGAVVCESTPGGKLVTKGKVICKASATKDGAQEFTSGTNHAGNVVGGSLTAESTIFGFFKETEPDSQETTEDLTYAAAVEQVE